MKSKLLNSFAILLLCVLFMSFDQPRLKTRSSESGQGGGSYGTSLINPPDSSIDFSFGGGQVVNLKLSNSNLLGVGGSVNCHTTFKGDESFWLLPMGSKTTRYDILGTSIRWSFTVSTISDAAVISILATWNK